MIEVQGGILEVDGSVIAGIREFSLDEEFDYGEARNQQYPTYANQIKGQDSWSASLSIDLYASEGSGGIVSSVSNLRSRARNHGTVNVVITYGGQPEYGDLGYEALTEEAQGKITSLSGEGSFMADGEVWTQDVEIEGFEKWTTV